MSAAPCPLRRCIGLGADRPSTETRHLHRLEPTTTTTVNDRRPHKGGCRCSECQERSRLRRISPRLPRRQFAGGSRIGRASFSPTRRAKAAAECSLLCTLCTMAAAAVELAPDNASTCAACCTRIFVGQVAHCSSLRAGACLVRIAGQPRCARGRSPLACGASLAAMHTSRRRLLSLRAVLMFRCVD